MKFTDYILPLIICGILIYALLKKVDVWSEFVAGAKENILVTMEILPALIGLLLAVGIFRTSGAIDLITTAISPILRFSGFPSECVPLALIRPISGSGALATFENILTNCPPDTFPGRVASVMYGGTETTFYTCTVYFAATKVRKLRHTIPCALVGDIFGPLLCVFIVLLFF
ncbi:MAG: spore maturation protein [Oscillospiraceae bacterium]|jgi:spore maturation protein B|nr:spore maturation protein [Oscillospiraceae bacterium]